MAKFIENAVSVSNDFVAVDFSELIKPSEL